VAKTYNYTVNGNQYYRTRAKIELNGKFITKAFLGDGKKDAEKKRDEYIASLGKNTEYDNNSPFIELLKEWHEVVHKPTVSGSSNTTYMIYIDRIAMTKLANKPLNTIKSLHIQKLINEQDVKTTARFYYIILKMFFTYCYDEHILNHDVMRGIKKARTQKSEKLFDNYLTDPEIEKLKKLGYDRDYFVFLFMLYTGLRRGEMSALLMSDIDLKKKLVTVSKSYSQVGNKFVLGSTKGRETRVVTIPDTLIPFIEHYFKVAPLGEIVPQVPRYLHDLWKYRRKKVTERNVTLHGLRHTYCTLLCRNGVQLKVAADLMGHKNTKLVDEVYTHVQIEDKYKAVKSL
jgi:integrase